MNERMRAAVPILPCADLERTMRFYVERLGFERRWVWPDPPEPGRPQTDGGVACGDVQVFFVTDPALAARSADRELMIFTADVDAQYAEHVARGAPVSGAPVDEPWGLREYTVVDPQGNRLRFAEGIEYVRARRGAGGGGIA